MRNFVTLVSASVILGVCCFFATAAQGQVDVQVEAPRKRVGRNQEEADRLLKEIRRRHAEEDAFIANFVHQPPDERVRLWRKNINTALDHKRMEQLLIARGTDAAPYLAEIVRGGKSYVRLFALNLLCNMDRFVSADQLLIPERGEYSEPLAKGRRDQFMLVDGRRIGPEAYAVVKWATEQTKDEDLRFHARNYTGLMEQDLRKLPLSEQLRQWREAVIKSKGVLGFGSDSFTLVHQLGNILVERAPESLPPLIDMLENDKSGYVREEAISVITWVDRYRMRLRGTEVGRGAIEAVQRALERGGLKPTHTNRERREYLWNQISSQVFDDSDFYTAWPVYAYMLEKLCSAQTTIPGTGGYNPVFKAIVTSDASPEWRRFRKYLTELDPFFPSWEYVYVGPADNELLHPRVRQKLIRYLEHWKRFEAEQSLKPGAPAHAAVKPERAN